jgi:hypothetical protein
MDVMADDTTISIIPKRAKDPSNDSSKIRFTSVIAVQVAILDSNKSVEYTDTLPKSMEYFNGNYSHPSFRDSDHDRQWNLLKIDLHAKLIPSQDPSR